MGMVCILYKEGGEGSTNLYGVELCTFGLIIQLEGALCLTRHVLSLSDLVLGHVWSDARKRRGRVGVSGVGGAGHVGPIIILSLRLAIRGGRKTVRPEALGCDGITLVAGGRGVCVGSVGGGCSSVRALLCGVV